MSTLIRTWTPSVNNLLDQLTVLERGQEFWRAFKDHMVAAGWTVKSSSDSVAFGVDDNVDRWDADIDLIWSSAGTAHSWIVLQQPTGHLPNSKQLRLLIDLSTGAASPHLVNLTISSSAINTGGSTTAAPTGTAADLRSYANKQWHRSTAAVDQRYHLTWSDEGDVLAFVSANSTTRIPFAIGVMIGGVIEATENYPCIFVANYADNSTGGGFVASTLGGVTAAALWDNDGTICSAGGMCRPIYASAGTDTMNAYGNGNNPLSSFGTTPAVPILLFTDGDTLGFRGTLVDLFLGPGTSGGLQGLEEPGSGTVTTKLIGSIWVPLGPDALQL